jgi:hypothetical protein
MFCPHLCPRLVSLVTPKALDQLKMDDCPVCCQALEWWPTSTTTCNHKFHEDCLTKWRSMSKTSCPVCRHTPVAVKTTTCSRATCQLPALTGRGMCIDHMTQKHFNFIPCGP